MEGMGHDLLRSLAEALAEVSSIRPFAAVSVTVRSALPNDTLRLLERSGMARFVARLGGPAHARANLDVLPLDRHYFHAIHGLEAYHITVAFEAGGQLAPAWQGTVAQLFDAGMKMFIPEWRRTSPWVRLLHAGLGRIISEVNDEMVGGIAITTGIRLGVHVQCGSNVRIRLCEPGPNLNLLLQKSIYHEEGQIPFGNTMDFDDFENYYADCVFRPDPLPVIRRPTSDHHAFQIFPCLMIDTGEVHLQLCKTVTTQNPICDELEVVTRKDMSREEILLFFDVLNCGRVSL